MQNGQIDILMITHNRPEYTKKSLQRLLDTCDDSMRVWIWHNGNHQDTLDVVRKFSDHSKIYKINISPENKKLTEPTNWLWSNADGEFLSKVDDDCVLPLGWAQQLRSVHNEVQNLGAIGCCRILDEDFDLNLCQGKIVEVTNRHRILQNCWVQGSGYLLKRKIVKEFGLLRNGQSFTDYCIALCSKGYVNGWYYPLLPESHLDDPRVDGTILIDDDSFMRNRPLTAINNNINSVGEWIEWIKNDDRYLQSAPIDYRYYSPIRRKIRNMSNKLRSVFR